MRILNFMEKSSKRLLVHRDMEEVEVKGRIDIVLTPQFYTFLREELEIKFAYQAKNIAHAFFDDYLTVEREHQYHVYKHGTEWYFFAYSIDEITSFLEEKGLASTQVGKIYFAQELEESLLSPVKISERFAMQTIEGTVTLLPQKLLAPDVEYHRLSLDDETLKQGIALSSSYDSLIPFKETAILTTLLLFLGGFFLFEGERGRATLENIELTQSELLSDYPMFSSSIVRGSELKKYEKRDKVERMKRETLMQVSKMISHKNRLKTLLLTEKNIAVTIITSSKQDVNTIKKLAKSNNFKVSNETSKEISLEKKI